MTTNPHMAVPFHPFHSTTKTSHIHSANALPKFSSSAFLPVHICAPQYFEASSVPGTEICLSDFFLCIIIKGRSVLISDRCGPCMENWVGNHPMVDQLSLGLCSSGKDGNRDPHVFFSAIEVHSGSCDKFRWRYMLLIKPFLCSSTWLLLWCLGFLPEW